VYSCLCDRQLSKGRFVMADTGKTPDIDCCPCCNAVVRVEFDAPVGKHPFYRMVDDSVAPRCEQTRTSEGGLGTCVLLWECKRCGCIWADGQFEATLGREG